MFATTKWYKNHDSGLALRRENMFLRTLFNLTGQSSSRGNSWGEGLEDGGNVKPSARPYFELYTTKPSVTPGVYEDIVLITPKHKSVSEEVKFEYKRKGNGLAGHELLTAFFEQVIPDFMSGKLNVHIWDHICGPYVEQLRQSPLFPRFPSHRRFITDFTAEYKETEFGERIFGYIHSKVNGFYQFAISSDDTSELWLSTDIDPKNARLIATVFSPKGIGFTKNGDFKKYPTQISRKILLKAGRKYYIEVLHKQAKGKSHLQVLWKKPHSKTFTKIDKKSLSLFVDDNDFKTLDDSIKEIDFEVYAPKDTPSHIKRKLDPTLERSIYKC